ncbi:HTH-type transcriptional regulator GmuR [compost metagenome]
MPLKIVTGLDEDILKGSIYNYIKSELNLIISAAQRVIIASKADEDDMKAFGLELGEPVLEVNQVVFLDDGRPFDVSKTRYPYTSGRIVAGINT